MNKEIMIACDFATRLELEVFLAKFQEKSLTLKIGMELFYREGRALVQDLKAQGYKIFLDLKLHDIPNTVAKALDNLQDLNVDYITVHAVGGSAMLKAAVAALKDSSTKLLAVTILTSIDETTLHHDLRIKESVTDVVCDYAKMASDCGIDGCICSPYEVQKIKAHVSKLGFECITPGIRLVTDHVGDQSRVATPQFSFNAGANAIVIGRSITLHEKPYERYLEIKDSLN